MCPVWLAIMFIQCVVKPPALAVGSVNKYHFGEIYAPIKYGCYQNCFDSQKAEHVGFYVDWSDGKCIRKDLVYWINMIDTVPVGNIFDNPELLQEESNE